MQTPSSNTIKRNIMTLSKQMKSPTVSADPSERIETLSVVNKVTLTEPIDTKNGFMYEDENPLLHSTP